MFQDHYGPQSAPVAPQFQGYTRLNCSLPEKLAAFDYQKEHRSGNSIGQVDCSSRLPATTAALNITAIIYGDASELLLANSSFF